MRGLYLHFFNLNEFSGISKKISYQIDALRECGLEMSICHMSFSESGAQTRLCDNVVIDDFGRGIWAKFGKWFLFSNLERYIYKNQIAFLYVRSFYNTNPSLLMLFTRLHKRGVKIVIEYPTYPYDIEAKSEHIRYQPIFLLNRVFRRFLKGRIDGIVTFTSLQTIDGVKCINISNAIDFKSVRLRERTNYNGSKFLMIAVAEVHFWHGYDRVIAGLKHYYSNRHIVKNTPEVHFYIVGEGCKPDRDALIELVKNEELEQYVHFHNNMYGKELDEIFDSAHFAIASLARHRTGITYIKTLKNREYAARGIPFAYSEIDDDFENMEYILKVPANDSPIDIRSLIEFFESRDFCPIDIRRSIEGNLSWKVQMKRVLDSVFGTGDQFS